MLVSCLPAVTCTWWLLLIAWILKVLKQFVWIAVVFKMHYTELLAKDDEITKLRAVIEGLSRK